MTGSSLIAGWAPPHTWLQGAGMRTRLPEGTAAALLRCPACLSWDLGWCLRPPACTAPRHANHWLPMSCVRQTSYSVHAVQVTGSPCFPLKLLPGLIILPIMLHSGRGQYRSARFWVLQSELWLPWATEAAMAAKASDVAASEALRACPLVVDMESATELLLSVSPVMALNAALSRLARLVALIGPSAWPA